VINQHLLSPKKKSGHQLKGRKVRAQRGKGKGALVHKGTGGECSAKGDLSQKEKISRSEKEGGPNARGMTIREGGLRPWTKPLARVEVDEDRGTGRITDEAAVRREEEDKWLHRCNDSREKKEVNSRRTNRTIKNRATLNPAFGGG